MSFSTIAQARAALLSGECSCAELVEQSLSQIDEGTHLNAFISVMAERARQKAGEVDARVAAGEAGSLAGTILAVKDLIVMKGGRVTCGSRILADFVSPYDATVVERLEAQDAVIIAKTNMDEFAMGSSNENSHFGAVRNPHDRQRVPGGSSGGSCAAVAAGMVTAALGSDTGGSIRQPAAFCGVVGLKPTYGRVSRYGLVAFASSFDQIGPIAQTVQDAGDLFRAMAGHDPKDSTSAQLAVPVLDEHSGEKIKGLRIGLPKEYFADGLAADIRTAIDQLVARLAADGAEIVDVSLPHTEYAIAAYYIITTAEASSNLARYDGARYGYRAEQSDSLEEMYVRSRSEGFGEEVKRRIMLGTYVLSAGYYDAYYRKAQQVRTLVRRDFEQAFTVCDCLLTPTTPTTAFKLGEKTADPLNMYLSDVYTVSVNLAGLPAMSVPCGVDSANLPLGVQIIGNAFDETTVLKLGRHIEQSRVER